jgi:hypothetical protein
VEKVWYAMVISEILAAVYAIFAARRVMKQRGVL